MRRSSMMSKSLMSVVSGMILVFLMGSMANAALIAHYDFGDGDLLDDEIGSYPLTQVGTVTANNDEIGSARFDGSGVSHLTAETMNYADGTSFTVSFWWRTETLSQDAWDSLMSTIPSGTGESWQIDDDGAAGLRLKGDSDDSIVVAQSTLSAETWYHMALVSDISGNNVSLYLTRRDQSAVELVGSVSDKLFYLTDLRIGANRGGDQTYDSDIAEVKVYNEALGEVTLNALLAEPPPMTINANGIAYTDKSTHTTTNVVISLPNMQAVLDATDDLEYAALFDGEISSANTSFSKDPNYPGTKAFTISGAKAHTSQGGYGGNSNASVIPTPSGTKHGWIGTTPNSMTWRFGPPAGGRITHVGFMWNDWDSWGTDVTVMAYFSGGSSITQTDTVGGWFWFGYAAPNGESITKLIVTKTNAGGNYGAFDDIVVVAEAAPENVIVTDVAITNHDFETGDTTGWELVGDGTVAAPAWGLLEGSKSAQISPISGGDESFYQTTDHTISSGETFTLTYLAGKSDYNTADNVGIIYYLDGASREPITTLNFGASPADVSVHGYAVSRVTALASDVPAAAYGKKLGIELAGRNANADAWLTVDDVTLQVSRWPMGTLISIQ